MAKIGKAGVTFPSEDFDINGVALSELMEEFLTDEVTKFLNHHHTKNDGVDTPARALFELPNFNLPKMEEFQKH